MVYSHNFVSELVGVGGLDVGLAHETTSQADRLCGSTSGITIS